jgi:hypothetical protein
MREGAPGATTLVVTKFARPFTAPTLETGSANGVMRQFVSSLADAGSTGHHMRATNLNYQPYPGQL